MVYWDENVQSRSCLYGALFNVTNQSGNVKIDKLQSTEDLKTSKTFEKLHKLFQRHVSSTKTKTWEVIRGHQKTVPLFAVPSVVENSFILRKFPGRISRISNWFRVCFASKKYSAAKQISGSKPSKICESNQIVYLTLL